MLIHRRRPVCPVADSVSCPGRTAARCLRRAAVLVRDPGFTDSPLSKKPGSRICGAPPPSFCRARRQPFHCQTTVRRVRTLTRRIRRRAPRERRGSRYEPATAALDNETLDHRALWRVLHNTAAYSGIFSKRPAGKACGDVWGTAVSQLTSPMTGRCSYLQSDPGLHPLGRWAAPGSSRSNVARFSACLAAG
jgi:hypothetical protein